MESEQRIKFFEGNALGLLIGPVMFGFFGSAIPDWSFRIFLLMMVTTFILLCIARYWYKTIPNTIRYNSLVAFLMLISMGLYIAIPILRISFHTMVFWPLLILYLLVMGYSLLKREMIFQAFHMPGKSKIVLGSYVFLMILTIISAFSFRNGQELVIMQLLSENQGLIFFSFILYLGGLFLSFIAFALLKKPEEI
ncbi:hypothetical protein [Bacillus timonensis]|uniref:hypothetical protein n=1 Tax=Bacillus timonensis TaxID=1033734 RepID=UPI0011DC84A0|nr:hypothetical protein [Bacillus timonensis]